MKQKLALSVLAAAAMLASGPSFAQQDQSEQPSASPGAQQTTRDSPIYSGRAATLNGTVESVDRVTKTISVKDEEGRVHMIRLNENSGNLEQLAKGTKVSARYQEAMLISIARSDAAPQVQTQATQEAPDTGQPAVQEVQHTSVVALVTDVDRKANRLTVETPNGEAIQMAVRDPKALQDLKTGDKVVATYIEAFALSISPQDESATAREAPESGGARQRQ
jgi:hypothetical protein